MFSMDETNTLRKAVAKKKEKEMVKLKGHFITGAKKDKFDKNGQLLEHGLTQEQAEALFQILVYFAEYGFNKAHSLAYSIITF